MPALPPVPDCEGPKLHPYQPEGAPEISFLELIGQGAHGKVFKVQIDGKILALKVFNLQFVDAAWLTADEEEWDKVDEELLTAQWHPFHAECRAYARLKEAKKEHLAVRCHGYLCLTEGQKQELKDRFAIGSWWNDETYDLDRPDAALQLEFQQESRRPLRAIVKDFIHGDVPFSPQHASGMIRDLHQLHRCGIVVWDLKEDAYLDGKLVDFSKAVVVPHMMFDKRLRIDLDILARDAVYADLSYLGSLFDEWNDEHEDGPQITCRPLLEGPLVRRLRRGPLTEEEKVARSFNPRNIDWQKYSRRSGGFTTVEAKRKTARKSDAVGKKPNGVRKQQAPARSKRTRL